MHRQDVLSWKPNGHHSNILQSLAGFLVHRLITLFLVFFKKKSQNNSQWLRSYLCVLEEASLVCFHTLTVTTIVSVRVGGRKPCQLPYSHTDNDRICACWRKKEALSASILSHWQRLYLCVLEERSQVYFHALTLTTIVSVRVGRRKPCQLPYSHTDNDCICSCWRKEARSTSMLSHWQRSYLCVLEEERSLVSFHTLALTTIVSVRVGGRKSCLLPYSHTDNDRIFACWRKKEALSASILSHWQRSYLCVLEEGSQVSFHTLTLTTIVSVRVGGRKKPCQLPYSHTDNDRICACWRKEALSASILSQWQRSYLCVLEEERSLVSFHTLTLTTIVSVRVGERKPCQLPYSHSDNDRICACWRKKEALSASILSHWQRSYLCVLEERSQVYFHALTLTTIVSVRVGGRKPCLLPYSHSDNNRICACWRKEAWSASILSHWQRSYLCVLEEGSLVCFHTLTVTTIVSVRVGGRKKPCQLPYSRTDNGRICACWRKEALSASILSHWQRSYLCVLEEGSLVSFHTLPLACFFYPFSFIIYCTSSINK